MKHFFCTLFVLFSFAVSIRAAEGGVVNLIFRTPKPTFSPVNPNPPVVSSFSPVNPKFRLVEPSFRAPEPKFRAVEPVFKPVNPTFRTLNVIVLD